MLNYVFKKTRVKLDGSCLKQNRITFSHRNTVNIYIAYEINLWDREYDDYPALENYFFGAIELIKNAHTYKYKYSGCGIERRWT